MTESHGRSDVILVRRAKKGDYGAFDLLILKYQHRIIGLTYKIVKDAQLAEDITQETFIKAYQSLKSFREESAFFTWLYRIASNTAKNYLSSRKRRKEFVVSEIYDEDREDIFDIPTSDSPEEILIANNLRDQIFSAFSSLPEEIRTALTMRELDGLSYEEISEILACPIGTVRSRIFRGREAIEKKIRPLITGEKTKKKKIERHE